MKTRKLGTLEVTALGVGCMGMSHALGKAMDIDEGAKVLRAAVDMGYTFFDTAKNYGYVGDDVRTVDVTVRRLREKIEDDPKNPRYIITIRGLGYKIEA